MRLRTLVPLAVCLLAGPGCAPFRPGPPTAAAQPASNTLFVPGSNDEALWERTVDVIHDYFDIARENKLDGVIETQAKVGATVFEPWHRDSVTARDRVESTLQSIRRRALVTIRRDPNGYLVNIQVFKELEDVPGLAANSPGAATFQTSNPLQRDLNLVVGQTAPSGWIVVGRDENLERSMLSALQREFSRS
jgi:hypothetical protein